MYNDTYGWLSLSNTLNLHVYKLGRETRDEHGVNTKAAYRKN